MKKKEKPLSRDPNVLRKELRDLNNLYDGCSTESEAIAIEAEIDRRKRALTARQKNRQPTPEGDLYRATYPDLQAELGEQKDHDEESSRADNRIELLRINTAALQKLLDNAAPLSFSWCADVYEIIRNLGRIVEGEK